MLIFSLTTEESQKEPSRFLLLSWVTIDGYIYIYIYIYIYVYITEIFTIIKNSYAPIMDLTTHLLKIKYFYYQIKILYSLRGIQPNLENLKA